LLNNFAILMLDLINASVFGKFRAEKDWNLLVAYLALEIKKVLLN